MIKWLVDKIIARCETKNLYYYIKGRPGNYQEAVYLIRYFIFRSRFCNIYLHRFLRSDNDDLHDHPWHFWTYMLQGAYTEMSPQGPTRRTMKKNKFKYMAPTHLHSVKVDKVTPFIDRAEAPLTLCITGPVQREWGFIKLEHDQWANEHNGETYYHWVPWFEYLNKDKNDRPYA